MLRIRVASLQYFIRPVATFAQFRDQVEALVDTARAAAREAAHILCVPTCTDERQGYSRVRSCAHARAIENQMS